mgnify:CR=1 FL=1
MAELIYKDLPSLLLFKFKLALRNYLKKSDTK